MRVQNQKKLSNSLNLLSRTINTPLCRLIAIICLLQTPETRCWAIYNFIEKNTPKFQAAESLNVKKTQKSSNILTCTAITKNSMEVINLQI